MPSCLNASNSNLHCNHIYPYTWPATQILKWRLFTASAAMYWSVSSISTPTFPTPDSLMCINGVVVTWVVAIRVEKLDPPGVRFPLNASPPSAALLFLGGFSFLGSFRVVQYHSPFGVQLCFLFPSRGIVQTFSFSSQGSTLHSSLYRDLWYFLLSGFVYTF